jgi:hypothetical protein
MSVMLASRIVVVAVIVAALAGCTGPGGPADPPADVSIDPWLADDLEAGAAVVTGEFMGVELIGLTCDTTQTVAASGDGDVRPTASVGLTIAGSSINYTEETLISTAQGADVAPTGDMPATVTVTTTRGFWDIGDGGANDPWTPTAVLALTKIPIPEGGCTAADMWFTDLTDVGTDTAEIIRAFSEDGLRNVAKECPDTGYTWVPPHLSCEEFEARAF